MQYSSRDDGCKDLFSEPSCFNRLARSASSYQLAPTLSQFAAASLVTASAGLGAVFAWSTGSAHGIILGALFVLFAVGLEIAKPLAVAAAFEALGSWQFVRGVVLAILATVAIAYSLSAELTLMAGTRGDVVAERQATINRTTTAEAEAKRARDRYDTAKTELGNVSPARPAAEVQAAIDALLLTPGADGCTSINGKVTREVCPQVVSLKIEKARADRKAELENILATPLSSAVPATTQEVADADPGASALATYLAALGIIVPVAVLTDWLSLVPVIALELGSAVAGILVQAVASPRRKPDAFRAPEQPRIEAPRNTPAQELVNGVPNAMETVVPKLPVPVQLAVSYEPRGSVPTCPKGTRDDDKGDGPSNGARLGTALLTHLKEKGGKVTAGQRGLAKLLDTSTTELNRTIHKLGAAGVLLVSPDRLAGTTLELAHV